MSVEGMDMIRTGIREDCMATKEGCKREINF